MDGTVKTPDLPMTDVGDWGWAVKVAGPEQADLAVQFLIERKIPEGTAREAAFRARRGGWLIISRDNHVRVLSDCA